MEVDLPIGIKIGRKNYALNLNIYRNAHYQTLNKMKIEFSKVIEPELMKLPSFKSVDLTYTLYPKTKRLCDIANVCSIVDKFFCDALVNIGKLPDDNYEYLKNIDPIAAEKISENDKKRIIRAIEIYKISGKTKTENDFLAKQNGSLYDNFFIGLNYADREILYNRINQRVDVMLKNSLLDEAKNAYNTISGTATQAIGHKEFFEYFNGNMPLEDAIERLKMQTRRYAKRQLTWFRKNSEINWIYMDEENNPIEMRKTRKQLWISVGLGIVCSIVLLCFWAIPYVVGLSS